MNVITGFMDSKMDSNSVLQSSSTDEVNKNFNNPHAQRGRGRGRNCSFQGQRSSISVMKTNNNYENQSSFNPSFNCSIVNDSGFNVQNTLPSQSSRTFNNKRSQKNFFGESNHFNGSKTNGPKDTSKNVCNDRSYFRFGKRKNSRQSDEMSQDKFDYNLRMNNSKDKVSFNPKFNNHSKKFGSHRMNNGKDPLGLFWPKLSSHREKVPKSANVMKGNDCELLNTNCLDVGGSQLMSVVNDDDSSLSLENLKCSHEEDKNSGTKDIDRCKKNKKMLENICEAQNFGKPEISGLTLKDVLSKSAVSSNNGLPSSILNGPVSNKSSANSTGDNVNLSMSTLQGKNGISKISLETSNKPSENENEHFNDITESNCSLKYSTVTAKSSSSEESQDLSFISNASSDSPNNTPAKELSVSESKSPNDNVNATEKDEKKNDSRQQNSPHNKQQRNKNNKNKPHIKSLWIRLDLGESFDDQAERMISQFELTPQDDLRVKRLQADLFYVLAPIIPNVHPVLFGSMVAGTAFKNSDVDIYLQCYDCLPADNVKDFIIKHGSRICRGGYFRQPIKIANARVPILKAIHCNTGISVDISFVVDRSEPHFGLYNSLLVRHLCSHDKRVRRLIMLILFWGKYSGFVGKYQMSSFSFILLVIFYLQVVEVLPPLYKLITVTEDAVRWPTTFNSDPSLLYNSNTQSLESLYLGFFTFYSAVRYNEVVISVYAGELVLGVLFETVDLLPQCYRGYQRLVQNELEAPLTRSDMCIQEPFNMSWNTVRSVNTRIMDLFKQSCHNVSQVFAKFSSQRIFSVVHSDYRYTEDEEDSYIWDLPCPPHLNSSQWFAKVLKATRAVFGTILLMNIHEGPHESDDYKFSKFNFVNNEIVNPVRLIVSCEHMVAKKERLHFVKAFKSKDMSELQKEVKASLLYLDSIMKKDKKFKFNATLFVAKNEKNDSVEVSVNRCLGRNNLRKQEHKQFVSYLKNENFKHFLSLLLESPPCKKVRFEDSLTE